MWQRLHPRCPARYSQRGVGQIVIENLTKEFPGGVRAVDDISLEIGEGEFMVLVGPSGCGKTTLLRSIGGLERVTSGRIRIGDRDVTRLEPGVRRILIPPVGDRDAPAVPVRYGKRH